MNSHSKCAVNNIHAVSLLAASYKAASRRAACFYEITVYQASTVASADKTKPKTSPGGKEKKKKKKNSSSVLY